MTRNDFMSIIRHTLSTNIGIGDSNMFPNHFDMSDDEKSLWSSVIANDGLKKLSTMERYDCFMAALVNERMMSIPWSENIVFHEFWPYPKNEIATFVDGWDMSGDPWGNRIFHFTANGVVNGIPGILPAKKYLGWRFLFKASRDNIGMAFGLSVVFRDPTDIVDLCFNSCAMSCRAMIVSFLKNAWLFNHKGV